MLKLRKRFYEVIPLINTVYTIGYSGFEIKDFIQILKKNKISVVIDVRSSPYSQYYSDYNKKNLEARLKTFNIHYRNYALEFGARQEKKEYYTEKGYLDFELFSKSKNFLKGIEKLKNAMNKNYRFILMCAEKNPITCHRAILVSRVFFEQGYEIKHILSEQNIISQNEIEEELLNKFFSNRNQLSLFGRQSTERELICEAYKKQNAIIGYFQEEEGEE